jgi:hypothetical protein
MAITCVFIFFAYSVAIPKQFDFDLIEKIRATGEKNNIANIGDKNSKCGNPKFFTEKENKVGLFFMIICHLFLGQFISRLDRFKTVLAGSYKKVKIASTEKEFTGPMWTYIGVNFVVWIVLGGIALSINAIYGAAGYGGNFGKHETECKGFSKKIFMNSMINLWIISDVAVCALSMPCLYLQYYMDKSFFDNQWLELMVHIQNNALKNFYRTNETAIAKLDDRSIINRITNRIWDKQENVKKEKADVKEVSLSKKLEETAEKEKIAE